MQTHTTLICGFGAKVVRWEGWFRANVGRPSACCFYHLNYFPRVLARIKLLTVFRSLPNFVLSPGGNLFLAVSLQVIKSVVWVLYRDTLYSGGTGGNRTHDLGIKSSLLLPTELRFRVITKSCTVYFIPLTFTHIFYTIPTDAKLFICFHTRFVYDAGI